MQSTARKILMHILPAPDNWDECDGSRNIKPFPFRQVSRCSPAQADKNQGKTPCLTRLQPVQTRRQLWSPSFICDDYRLSSQAHFYLAVADSWQGGEESTPCSLKQAVCLDPAGCSRKLSHISPPSGSCCCQSLIWRRWELVSSLFKTRMSIKMFFVTASSTMASHPQHDKALVQDLAKWFKER